MRRPATRAERNQHHHHFPKRFLRASESKVPTETQRVAVVLKTLTLRSKPSTRALSLRAASFVACVHVWTAKPRGTSIGRFTARLLATGCGKGF